MHPERDGQRFNRKPDYRQVENNLYLFSHSCFAPLSRPNLATATAAGARCYISSDAAHDRWPTAYLVSWLLDGGRRRPNEHTPRNLCADVGLTLLIIMSIMFGRQPSVRPTDRSIGRLAFGGPCLEGGRALCLNSRSLNAFKSKSSNRSNEAATATVMAIAMESSAQV